MEGLTTLSHYRNPHVIVMPFTVGAPLIGDIERRNRASTQFTVNKAPESVKYH